MKVTVKQSDGLTVIARGESNHWVVLDGSREFGGNEAGTKPVEMLLISLAACTAMDVISLLNKMRVDFNRLEVEVDSEREGEHPKVFKSIHLHYFIYGKNPDEKKIEKAIEKSQTKYCSVTAMLEKAVKITSSYTIKNHQ